MTEMTYKIPGPHVVAETIDGETIAINLETGRYFSMCDSAATIWQLVMDGCTISRIMAKFEGDVRQMGSEIASFIQQLVDEGLVASSEAETSEAPDAMRKMAYATPRLEVYTDLQDLLILDPIHDVDEQGWPRAKTRAV